MPESLFSCKYKDYYLVVNYEGNRLAYISESSRMLELAIGMKQESDFEYNSSSNGCQTNYSRGITLFGKSLLFVGSGELVQLDVEASLLAAAPITRTFPLEHLETFYLDRSSETIYLTSSADCSVATLSLNVSTGQKDDASRVRTRQIDFGGHLPSALVARQRISAIGGTQKHLYLATFEESEKSATSRIWKVNSYSLEVRAQLQLPANSGPG